MLPADRIDPASAPLDGREREHLSRVDCSLGLALALRRWWLERHGDPVSELTEEGLALILRGRKFDRVFRLTKPNHVWPEFLNYGFFSRATVASSLVPVSGLVQQLCFDRMKLKTGHSQEQWLAEFRKFLQSCFFQSANLIQPIEPFGEPRRRRVDSYLKAFSWHYRDTEHLPEIRDHSTVRLYYKRSRDGQLGKFRRHERSTRNVREVGPNGPYEWVVYQARRHFTDLRVGPIPALNEGHLVIPRVASHFEAFHAGFQAPRPSTLPEGVKELHEQGFALLASSTFSQLRCQGFGHLQVLPMDDGRVLARFITVQPRPDKLTGPVPNPLTWSLTYPFRFLSEIRASAQFRQRNSLVEIGFDPVQTLITAANLLTAGRARKDFGISRDHLERRWLTETALDFSRFADISCALWRAADWSGEVPEWAREPTRTHRSRGVWS